ncbi:MAG: protein nirF [Betaproteobacteria bacterium]|nr:protein nirF [Betaproteobacteria bacterium]
MTRLLLLIFSCLVLAACAHSPVPRGTGDLGVIIERTTGSVQIVQVDPPLSLGRVEGLGDLSHATAVFSRDQRYAYIFGRDGGLTKLDLLTKSIAIRVIQGGNSIGGAISQDGKLIAVGNYEPGGVKVFDAETLKLVADIPATPVPTKNQNARVVGIVDAPGQCFLFSLFDTGEIWLADFSKGVEPELTRYPDIGKQPYDALITMDGRYYIAGLFGEDGLAKLDLWHLERGVERILPNYGQGEQKLPVYKMPHLEGWTAAGDKMFVPAVGIHRVLVVENSTWQQIGAIDVAGQPIFVVARPDSRQVWVNFAHPNNDKVQVIDTESQRIIATLDTGPAVMHMEFTSRGDQLWLSVRDANEVQVWNPYTLEKIATLPAKTPSGIFFSSRAHKIGL